MPLEETAQKYAQNHVTVLDEYGCVTYSSFDARVACNACCLLLMCNHVFLETGTLSELFLTNATFVWLFVRMREHVRREMATFGKRLVTRIAFVWPFAGMR